MFSKSFIAMRFKFGFMLMVSLMLFASAGFASHAPPEQKADVSISCFVPEQGNFADITANPLDETPAFYSAVCVDANCLMLKPVELIAVDSGQGYKRSQYATINIEKLAGKKTAFKQGSSAIRLLRCSANSNA